MSLPTTNGIFIHNGYNCTPSLVPTAQNIQMSASDSTTVNSAIGDKMDKSNPTGTGSLSLNRASGSAEGDQSVALGLGCTASGDRSFAAGYNNTASGAASFCSGYGNEAKYLCQYVFGMYNAPDVKSGAGAGDKGNYIEIVGNGTISTASNARTLDWDGNEVLAGSLTLGGSITGVGSLSMNRASGTTGVNSTTLGTGNTASGTASHAEGTTTIASGARSHTEGESTQATGDSSHAEGLQSIASGNRAHAEGALTIAQRRSQHVFGEFNIADTGGTGPTVKGTYIEIVGNGSADESRSNARTLDWSGNEVLAGDLTINGSTSVTNALAGKVDGSFSGTATSISMWSNTTGSANIAINTNTGKQFVITINNNGQITGSVINPS